MLSRPRKAKPVILLRTPSSLERIREKGISRARDNKEIPHSREIIVEGRIIVLSTHRALNAERSTQGYAEWGPMFAISVVKRDISLGTVPRTPRTRTLHSQAGMHPVSFMQFKLDWKDPQLRKAE